MGVPLAIEAEEVIETFRSGSPLLPTRPSPHLPNAAVA